MVHAIAGGPGRIPADHPEVRTLDPPDTRSILARNNVARLAYSLDGAIDIRPIHYAFTHERIFGRTAAGTQLDRLITTSAPIAFEIDEVESMLRWRSVIVRGTLRGIEESDGESWQEAVTALRRVVRNALDGGDPYPERGLVFEILVEEITGRASA